MNHSRRQLLRLLAAGAALPAFSADGPRAAKTDVWVRSARPEDIEMPLDGFKDYLTPIERFFVRSHHYEPKVEMASWRLELGGQVSKPLTLTMDELRRMPKVELVSVLECAGNGRAFYTPSVPGLQWKYGGVGNAKWGGVRLGDILKRAGIKPNATEILFDGADVPIGTMPEFQRTIPAKKALDPNTLLAFEMNGQPLPQQHGFPLRLIVPGWAGDSWVKWVTRIEVLDHEFEGFFMKTAYRHPGKPVKPGEAVDPAQMRPVTSLRVKSVIGAPLAGRDVAAGKPLRVSGAAWAGDNGPVSSVEVSLDAGRSWKPAQLGADRSPFGWRLWSYEFTPQSTQFYTIMARARTAAGDVQPFVEEWNPSGYQWNVIQSAGVNAVDVPSNPVARSPAATPAEHPPGYKAACLTCHGEDVITQQKLTRGQWDKEIDKMVRWGAPVKPAEREGILRYLSGLKWL